MSNSKTIETVLMGQSYRFSVTDEDENSLIEAIAAVDSQMKLLREKSKVKTIERIAVLTALHFAGENLRLQKIENNTQVGLSADADSTTSKEMVLNKLAILNQKLDSVLP